MSEQDLNNEKAYEMQENDIPNSSNSEGLVGKSTVKEIIDSAGNIDPSRFWIVFMIALILGLASIIIFAGGYLIDQGNQKDKDIAVLRTELKDCPDKTLEDLKKQQEAIDALKQNALYDQMRIQEIKNQKEADLKKLEKIDNQLKTQIE